ncbi:MAG: energy transducer TonB [Candidatus Delongbacteria bacterium]|nr:energy transducer TonB [Candidatus Delongbacteria bacterium]MBN2833763.1 energy transducer TonB [Candidatus Delongbacteria bacterium]
MAHEVGRMSAKYSRISDIIAIVVLLIFTAIFTFHHRFEEVKIVDNTDNVVQIEIEQVEITRQEVKTVKPKKVFVPVAVEDEEELDEDQEIDIDISDFNMDDPPPPPPAFIESVEDDEIIDFFAVQQPPEIIGGLDQLYKNLDYPEMARKLGKDGNVILKFICSKDGVPVNIQILRESPKDMGFGEAAKKALSQCRFKPGMQRDKPVSVSMKQPVKFQVK